jgi:hypothetical protein
MATLIQQKSDAATEGAIIEIDLENYLFIREEDGRETFKDWDNLSADVQEVLKEVSRKVKACHNEARKILHAEVLPCSSE